METCLSRNEPLSCLGLFYSYHMLHGGLFNAKIHLPLYLDDNEHYLRMQVFGNVIPCFVNFHLLCGSGVC